MPMPIAMIMKPKVNNTPPVITGERVIYLNQNGSIYVRSLYDTGPGIVLVNPPNTINHFNINSLLNLIVFSTIDGKIYLASLDTGNYNFLVHGNYPSLFIGGVYNGIVYSNTLDGGKIYGKWFDDVGLDPFPLTYQSGKYPQKVRDKIIYVGSNENIYLLNNVVGQNDGTQITNLEIGGSSTTWLDVSNLGETNLNEEYIIYNGIYHNIAPSMKSTLLKQDYSISNGNLNEYLFGADKCNFVHKLNSHRKIRARFTYYYNNELFIRNEFGINTSLGVNGIGYAIMDINEA